MNRNLCACLAACLLVFLCSCTTSSTITEYNEDGKVIKTVKTKENVAHAITKDLEKKNVVICSNGWGVKLDAGAQIENGFAPALNVSAGKLSNFYGSFLKGTDGETITGVVAAWHEPLSVSREGITTVPIVDSDTESPEPTVATGGRE